jgi:iron(III) transport system ATP-binding protein
MSRPDLSSPLIRASAVIPATLGFEGVTKRFDSAAAAVDGFTFTARPGEVVCLLGPSGCGKSTLLRLAAGIETPDEGIIRLDGKEIAGPSTFVPPEKRGIGLVFQDYALFPHIDALHNVGFGIRNLDKREALSVADAALRRVGLGHRLRAMPHELSGGEQQRVALARAIVPRPRVLLMDEPFSNLDSRMRDAVREETIALLRETGATAFIVTHDPEEAMRIADRIVLMRQGRIVQAGSGRDIYERPADVETARFFCDLNEIVGESDGTTAHTALGSFALPEGVSGKRVIVAVRPQGVLLRAPDCGIPGRIIAHRFLGEVDHVDVAVQGLERPLRSRMRGAARWRAGQNVGVEIAPSEVLVFALQAA